MVEMITLCSVVSWWMIMMELNRHRLGTKISYGIKIQIRGF